jgi:hypothetical protein
MSRGPGRWQRVLLDALAEFDVLPVLTVAYNTLGREPTRSELVAVRRAARTLAEAGTARALYLGQCPRCGEVYESWTCRTCRIGTRRVLVLVRPEFPEIKSLMSSAIEPSWVSVAPVQNVAQATLSEAEEALRVLHFP